MVELIHTFDRYAQTSTDSVGIFPVFFRDPRPTSSVLISTSLRTILNNVVGVFIGMFKYIKEILSQISPAQRFMALVIILFSISLILVGPKIVESLTQSNEELIVIMNRQREQIIKLNSELSELNLEMIKNKTECTDLVIQREKEILTMIEGLQRGLMFSSNRMVSEPRAGSGSIEDTVSNVKKIQYLEDDRIPMMIDGLEKIKVKLKSDIKTSN